MCKKGGAFMPTNLAIDDQLLEDALRIGGQRTKKATVNEALKEYIDRRKRLQALEAFGSITMDSAYDYKKLRRRR
jgi:Arc/MetJ family transcription regulator